ncbi:MAG: carbohydrate-binding domain-containing protein [Oscillibacter sp.]|nr:carbohydrate-binding domain-containing protein [Oscillibacter sp.]
MRSPYKRAGAALTVFALLLTLFPARMSAADSESVPSASVTFTFTDSGVTASDESASGYEIDGASLTITAAGTYAVTGSCSEGNVTVKKSVTGVILILDNLTLACSTTAPLLCKKSTGVTLWLNGDSALTDNENPDDENSEDATVADAFEGAAVKVNSESASLLIKGSGSLTADGSACKNGIKAGSTSSITVSGGTLHIKAANNGLAADGAVIIKGGTLDITAANDGIKASPDDDDTESAGTITIYDGNITVDAESDGINAAGDITIYGGTFVIDAQSDGIQTDGNLTISDGTFHITTLNGYNSSGFDSDTMSCKGLKASASDDDTDDASNTITITGGAFTLNTADDAIHSDAYIEITGGQFAIQTGDDGAHADTSLILGTNGGTVARDPDMTVSNSYEGLEAGTVYIYSGRYSVRASDDGINAAGGNGGENGGFDPGGGGGNHFNPGGGGPGGRMMGGFNGARLFADSDYSINIMGGNVYVNADGDGLDSNGALTLTGGNIEVWGQSSGDNEPLDSDGTLTVNGATVFAAGCAGMGVASPSNGSQGYTSYGGTSGGFGGGPGGWGGGSSSASSISSGALISVTNGASTVYQASAPKAVSYVFFSSPDASSSYSISSGSGSVSCQYGNDWTHSWNDGVVTTAATESAAGVRTYTCSVCGATATETIPQLVTIPEDSDDSGDTGDTGDSGDSETDTGYAVTFVADDCIINVYYTQDYTSPSESGVSATVSRSSSTGQPDSSGDGQVNFTVVPADGYTVEESNISIEGTYKNL